MGKKYLAYISALEDITGKPNANCVLRFITGDLDGKTITAVLSTDIFNYYYYGTTMEVVEFNEAMQIVSVHDLTADEYKEFEVSMYPVLALNAVTFDMLAANDFPYNLKVNKFYNYCKSTVDNMLSIMCQVHKFVLRVYTINGAVIYIQLETNPKSDNKYVLSNGFVVMDKTKLRGKTYTTASTSDKKDKLKQEDIDTLVDKYKS